MLVSFHVQFHLGEQANNSGQFAARPNGGCIERKWHDSRCNNQERTFSNQGDLNYAAILPRKRPGNTVPGLISELLATPDADQSLQFKVTNSRRREQKICIAMPTFYGLPSAPGGSRQLRR